MNFIFKLGIISLLFLFLIYPVSSEVTFKRMIYVPAWDGALSSKTAVTNTIDDAAYMNCDAIMLLITSTYLEADRNPAYASWDTRASWDMIGYAIEYGHSKNIEIHAWIPINYVNNEKQAEQRLFGDKYKLIYRDGKMNSWRNDLTATELKNYELGILGYLAGRYKNLDGIHLEEPHFQGRTADNYAIYTDAMRSRFKNKYGYDPMSKPDSEVYKLIHREMQYVLTDFFIEARDLIKSKNSNIKFSANGVYTYYRGVSHEDIDKYQIFDWFAAQSYRDNMPDFVSTIKSMDKTLPNTPHIAIAGITYTKVYPDSNPAFFEQIKGSCQSGSASEGIFAHRWRKLKINGQTAMEWLHQNPPSSNCNGLNNRKYEPYNPEDHEDYEYEPKESILKYPVKIYDTKVSETSIFSTFQKSKAYANKENWVQVPYDTTDYTFKGNALITNGIVAYYFHDSGIDSPFFYPIINGEYSKVNENYISRDPYYWNRNQISIKILKNTKEEVKIRYEAMHHQKQYQGDTCIVDYTLDYNSNWIKMKGAEQGTYNFGSHSEASTFAAAPPDVGFENMNDQIFDPAFAKSNEGSPDYFNPDDSHDEMLLQMAGKPWDHDEAVVIMPTNPDNSYPRGRYYYDTSYYPDGCIETLWQMGIDSEISVCLGATNTERTAQIKKPNIKINAGSTYNTKFKQPVTGIWRMSGQIGSTWYTQEVTNGDFTFTAPVSGTLQTVVWYLYDRTESTPKDSFTIKDVYNGCVLNKQIEPEYTNYTKYQDYQENPENENKEYDFFDILFNHTFVYEVNDILFSEAFYRPDKTETCIDHICYWADIVGYERMVKKDGIFYIGEDLNSSAVIMYDVRHDLIGDWDADELDMHIESTELINNTYIVNFHIHFEYSHTERETTESGETRTRKRHYTKDYYFSKTDINPPIQYPEVQPNNISVLYKYNSAIPGNKGKAISEINLTQWHSKITYTYDNDTIIFRQYVYKIEVTPKMVPYGNMTILNHWDDIRSKKIKPYKNTAWISGPFDYDMLHVSVFDPFREYIVDPEYTEKDTKENLNILSMEHINFIGVIIAFIPLILIILLWNCLRKIWN